MIASLANHLWQSTFVAVLAWLVTLALRRDRAGIRHGVWLAASVKFLIPFSMLTSVGARFGWRPIVVASFTPHELMVDSSGLALPERAVRIVAAQSAGSPVIRSLGSALPAVLIAVASSGTVSSASIACPTRAGISLVGCHARG